MWQKYYGRSLAVRIRNVHRLTCLDTWSPVGGSGFPVSGSYETFGRQSLPRGREVLRIQPRGFMAWPHFLPSL